MVAGAPRTVSLPKKEMISLGEEMVKWVLKNEKSVLHLSEWYTIHKGFTYNEWKAFLQVKEFLPHYEKALKIVGKKYLDKTSNVRDGISQRWQRVYYKDIKEEEDETSAFNANLNKVSTDNAPNDMSIDVNTENMRLKNRIRELEDKYVNKSKAG